MAKREAKITTYRAILVAIGAQFTEAEIIAQLVAARDHLADLIRTGASPESRQYVETTIQEYRTILADQLYKH